jgi:hypothetical protein
MNILINGEQNRFRRCLTLGERKPPGALATFAPNLFEKKELALLGH